jgi:hypothetical protein
MTNASFPQLFDEKVLKTTYMKVGGEVIPHLSMTTIKEAGSTISFGLKAAVDSTPIQVDYGNGIWVFDTIGTDEVLISDTLMDSQTVIIYGHDITYLNCENNQLISLETIDENSLLSLSCSNNQLTELDLSKSLNLNSIDCSHNCLNSFKVNNDTALKKVSCNYNQLTFATLPIEPSTWYSYSYAPQEIVPIVRIIKVGTGLDLSAQYSINSLITMYTWKTQNADILVEGIDYTIANGTTVFLKPQTDSIYCEMTNNAFPDFTGSDVLKTTNIKIELTTTTEDILFAEPKIYSCNKTIFTDLPFDAQISIFDINGRLVVSKFVNSGLNTIQIPNSGIYFVRSYGNEGLIVQKIFIQ